MSKIAKVVCALAGAAVNGAVAAVSGGNPILVALSGGATGLVAEEVGEIVREDEICYLAKEKPDVFQKLVAETTSKKVERQKTNAPDKAIAERILAGQARIEAAQARIEAAEIEKKAKATEAEALQAETKASETKKSREKTA